MPNEPRPVLRCQGLQYVVVPVRVEIDPGPTTHPLSDTTSMNGRQDLSSLVAGLCWGTVLGGAQLYVFGYLG